MKKVFLTGASSGIGLAIAQSLIARGDEVWGTSRNLIRLEPVTGLHPVLLDLSDTRSIDEAFKNALSKAGHFDVVINNAGSGHLGPAEHLSDAEIERQFQVLLFGHIQLMRLTVAAMQQRGQGLIINVTSLASRLPVPFMAAYNAAISDAAKQEGATLVDLHLNGTQIGQHPEWISADGFHPSEQGYAVIAKLFEDAYRRVG